MTGFIFNFHKAKWRETISKVIEYFTGTSLYMTAMKIQLRTVAIATLQDNMSRRQSGVVIELYFFKNYSKFFVKRSRTIYVKNYTSSINDKRSVINWTAGKAG